MSLEEPSSSSKPNSEPLGASEFAATLNGDNPTAILRALKRFTRTVRRERRIALSSDENEEIGDDDDDNSSDDDDSETGETRSQEQDAQQPPPAKKLKKTELWKEDTNAYHVPFVGTAVSRGDIAEVVRGEWPTGLLQMYLTKSPLAVELTSDDWIPSSTSSIHKSLLRRKQTKFSREIYKAYLKALSELVTVAIPVEKLREDFSVADSTNGNDDNMDLDKDEQQLHPFLSVLLKKRLVGMFHLLVEETDKGRGKPGIYGGCGSLVALALKFLKTVSRTSISNARLVCRYLDEELSDGVLKAIIRPPPPPRNKKDPSENTDDEKGRASLTKPSRIEAIRLATALLQTGDSAVATYICTAGSRERKVKPGILYGAFREGLAKHAQADGLGEMDDGDDYFDCVADMLEFSRKLLMNPQLSKVIGSKLLLDLFSKDTLYHLCDLAAHAPPLSTGWTFQQVMSGTDEPEEEDTEALSYAGIEARRLIFLLLGDLARSPILGNNMAEFQLHVLVNVMLRMLQTRNAGVQLRQFLLHCVQASPMLLPEFFRVIIIPDSKKAFDFISTLRFVSNLIENGPSPLLCLQGFRESLEDNTDLTQAFAALCPIKLKRQTLGKAMQSDNPVVVLECVKFIRSVLGRFHSLVTSLSEDQKAESFVSRLSTEFAQFLPEVQVILAVRSKYDLSSGPKGTHLVCHGLHVVLQNYSEILPQQIRRSSFDWMKLLPAPAELLKASPLVQRRVVSCLFSILQVCAGMSSNHINSIGSVLEIMLRTKDKLVHSKCREIAMMLLFPLVESRSTGEESIAYFKVEVAWWLDAVTLPSLSSFCGLVSLCADDSLAILGRLGEALSDKVDTLQLHWSIIMIAALSEIDGDEAGWPMILQVATRSFVFQRNPIPFACFINSLMKSPESPRMFRTQSGGALVEYATSLFEYEETHAKKRLDKLMNLLKNNFSLRHDFCVVLGNFLHMESLDGTLYPRSFQTAIELARFSIHVHSISLGLDWIHKSCDDLLRRTIPYVLLSNQDQLRLFSSQVISDVQILNEMRPFSILCAILSSHPEWDETGAFTGADSNKSILSRMKNYDPISIEDQDTRSFLLQLALLGQAPSSNGIVKTQLRLLEGYQPKGSAAAASTTIQVVLNLVSTCDPNNPESIHSFDFEVLSQLFELWWSTPGDELSGVFAQQLFCPLRKYFAKLLSTILSTNSVEATFLLTLLTTKSEDCIIDRCLGLDHPTDDHGETQANARVLESILQSDPLRFGPHFLARFYEKMFLQSTTWSLGLLDGVVTSLVGHPAIQSMESSSLSALGDAIFSRTSTVLEAMQASRTRDSSLGVGGTNNSILNLTNEVLLSDVMVVPFDELASAISGLLCATLNAGNVSKSDELGLVFRLGTTLYRQKDRDSSPESLRQLSSALFCTSLIFLATSYKHVARGGDTEHRLDCQAIVDFLISLFESEQDFEPSITSRANTSMLQKIFRSALKYGIQDGDEGVRRLAASSLKFVRLLSKRLSSSKTLSDHFMPISPSDLFEMLTSHSKFIPMLSRKRNSDLEENDRVELIRLMHCCVALSPDKTLVEPGLWEILYCAFRAGVDELDTAIRGFFYLCSTIEGKNISLPFFDEVRWSSCVQAKSREGRRWDWLLEAIDINRIRETVACFPINDSFDFDTSTSGLIATPQADSDDNGPFVQTQAERGFVSRNDIKGAEDSRYSPAFILPLVLGALHSCSVAQDVISEMEGDETDKNDQHLTRSNGPLVPTAKALIEKGVPALCLASLASACKKNRGLSISILGILLTACRTEEARSMSSWRERPQIAMLLNSIQRAYVLLETAKLPDREDADIPSLPSLVSTFLARSSLSISRPDDSLYVPLNRFFLKSDADHGAFQDMSRLPNFISLYCSSSDDPVQSRKERIWALQLIRDGFLDPSCYRLVSSCHAPELLMSSFENVRLSSFSDEMKNVELVLLLDSIKTFLDRGGRKGGSHLIGKIGLLSWLRSLCTSRPIATTFPLESTRVVACELINSAVQAVARDGILFKPALIDEVCGLITPTLALFAVSEADKRGSNRVVGPCVRALSCISDLLHQLNELEDFQCPDIHPAGLSADEAMKLVKSLPSDDLLVCIEVFTCLPFRLDQGCAVTSATAGLCMFLLEWSSKSETELTIELATGILNRVILIAEHFGGDFEAGANESLVRILLSSRARYQGTEENNLLWIECLELLSLRLQDGGTVAQLSGMVLQK